VEQQYFDKGSITGRITETGTDTWGRWSYQTYQGKNLCKVTILTIYQVVDKFTNQKGTVTTYAQQQNLLIQQGEAHINPRQAFIQRSHASSYMQIDNDHQTIKNEILILGDFNERIGDNPQGIARIAAEFEPHRHTPMYNTLIFKK
jgi:hypothetical protein